MNRLNVLNGCATPTIRYTLGALRELPGIRSELPRIRAPAPPDRVRFLTVRVARTRVRRETLGV